MNQNYEQRVNKTCTDRICKICNFTNCMKCAKYNIIVELIKLILLSDIYKAVNSGKFRNGKRKHILRIQ